MVHKAHTITSNRAEATRIYPKPSRSLQAFATSIRKPVESNNKQPRSLRVTPLLGVPRIDQFPIFCSNMLCGAHGGCALQVIPLWGRTPGFCFPNSIKSVEMKQTNMGIFHGGAGIGFGSTRDGILNKEDSRTHVWVLQQGSNTGSQNGGISSSRCRKHIGVHRTSGVQQGKPDLQLCVLGWGLGGLNSQLSQQTSANFGRDAELFWHIVL